MKHIHSQNRKRAAILAYLLVPLSGLATDVYLPSFPEMSRVFGVGDVGIQMTLTIFLISYGLGQIVAGTLLDSFGRYRPTLWALAVFVLTNVLIVFATGIEVVYILRGIQGICVSFIAVAKRAFFVDVYIGEKQKSYTALVTVIWSTAPIIAPFLGGFLEKYLSWRASFYFLGLYGVLLLVLELFYSGETLRTRSVFLFKPIVRVYKKLLSARDFTGAVILLGVAFCMVISFNMAIPFIIEHQLHLSPVYTGYCALCSGSAILLGGLTGRKWGISNLFNKSFWVSLAQMIVILMMLFSLKWLHHLALFIGFVFLIHYIEGLFYNILFTQAVTRFPDNAATAGGITSGGGYMVISLIIAAITSFIALNSQKALILSYFLLSCCILILLLFFKNSIIKANKKLIKESIDHP